MALGRCGAAAAPAVPDLLAAISDEDEDLRVIREAITALGMVGPKAADAVPSLETLTQHEDRQIAARAKAALRQIKGGL
jgi:HEAT repeat protein